MTSPPLSRAPLLARCVRLATIALCLGATLAAGCAGDSGDAGPGLDSQVGADAAADAGGGTDVLPGTDTTIDVGGTDSGGTDAGGTDAGTDAGVTDVGGTDVGGTDVGAEDTGGMDTGGEDTGGEDTGGEDTGGEDTGGEDTGGEDTFVAVPVGTLLMEDQQADAPYTTVVAREVALPAGFGAAGKLRVMLDDGGVPGSIVGQATVTQGTTHEDLPVVLSAPIVGEQAYFADLVKTTGEAFLGSDGEPLLVQFKAVGDTEDPELVMASQDLPPGDLKTLTASFVRVPARFAVGVWLDVYADDGGAPGAILGKQKLLPGDHEDTAVTLTSNLTKGQVLHAVLREGAKGTGSWAAGSPLVTNFAGQVVETSFTVDSEDFHAVLEIEDQVLADPKKLTIKKVVVPKEHFGGWLAIYADDAGQAGELVGKLYFVTGTKVNQTLSLTVPQEGEKTLHAVLYAGQMWDDGGNNVVMKAPGGGGMTLVFKVGAASLSYIIAEPYTTENPRHVMVTRAYSYDKPAWVLLAQDDGGKPGTVIARKKILPKFAGNVHLWNLTGDFLQGGTVAEYLKGEPGTYRHCARGDETLHVLLHEDFPSDNDFTYTPGGTDDLPVLDAEGQPVTALLSVNVKASIQNVQKDSSRYYLPCPLSQHVDNPTKLPVDCRCHVDIVGLDFPECKADIADYLSMQYGSGPRARTHNFGGFHSGFAEPSSGELIALMSWKDHKTIWPENLITIDVGAVMAIDLETRDRRLIGGRYEDPATGIKDVGAGPVLSYPFEVQKGPDGNYYVASYGYVRIGASLVFTVDIIRMDPATGDREYVWRSNHLGQNLDGAENPYGHCANGRTEKFGYESVQVGRKAFGIDGAGNFYLSYAHNGYTPTSDGIGIIKVSADGKQCDFVTRTKVGKDNVLYKGESIGTGFEPQAGPYKGMLVKDGKLYTSTELNDELVEVDIATGNRTLLHKDGVTDNNTGSSGTHVLWDAHRSLIWQGGLSGATLLFDPATGTSEPLWCPWNDRDYLGIACLKPAAWGNNGLPMERGMWIHPTDPEIMFVVNYSMIQRVDLAAGTSEIFSY